MLLPARLDPSDPLMDIIGESEKVVIALRKRFPTLVTLLTHQHGITIDPGHELAEWLDQGDHIEMDEDVRL